MSGITFEVIFIFFLILANGLLAMAEIAVVSARKARLQQLANEGDQRARAALELAENPGDFLSTVQIGITLVGILAGALGGATIAEAIADQVVKIPALAPYSQAIGVGLVVLAITYFSLVLGELAPKRIAINNPERIASRIAIPMRMLSRITAPVVRVLSSSSGFVLRLLGIQPSAEPGVTEEEIKVLIEQGTEAGIFEEAEQDMVAGVFRLGDRRVNELMTPRTEVVWLDLEDPPEEIQRTIVESVHTRFPVAKGSLDEMQGIVESKDMLARSLQGLPLDLQVLLEPPYYVPESMPALQVLEAIKKSRLQMVMVIDEFGGLQGLVTLNDILEAIVGDIPIVGMEEEPEIVRREDGSWLLDGRLPVDEFKELFGIRVLPQEERGIYQTLAGFVVTFLGRIPSAGDDFEWEGLRFEVMDMDELRVDKVLVVPVSQDFSV